MYQKINNLSTDKFYFVSSVVKWHSSENISHSYIVENLAIIFILIFRFVQILCRHQKLTHLKNKVKLQMFELQTSKLFFYIFQVMKLQRIKPCEILSCQNHESGMNKVMHL